MSKTRRSRNRHPSDAAAAASGTPPSFPPSESREAPCSWRRSIALVAVLIGAVAILAAVEAHRLLNNPGVYFLRQEAGAEWIRSDDPFRLELYRVHDTGTIFGCPFTTTQTLRNARLSVRAFRHADVMLDGQVIATGTNDLLKWHEPIEVPIPGPLPPGAHELKIRVTNQNAHSCVWASSQELGIRTGPGWLTFQKGGRWIPALSVTYPRMPTLASEYPPILEAFLELGPWLLVLVAVAFAWTSWNSRPGHRSYSEERTRTWLRWRFTARRVRWLLLAAWVVLGANNIWQVPSPVGFDLKGHLDYVEYIAQRRSLPLATEGWQTFQPPLFYLLAAPWYAILSPHCGPDTLAMALRFLPLLCGLAQIEIVYRTARAIFPENDDLQTVGTVVGGLMPMHIYISQVLGNEPLAGCLSSLVILMCVLLLVEPARRRKPWFFVAMGLAWGFAILSKATPLLLGPLVAAAIAISCRAAKARRRSGIVQIGLVFGTTALTSGWFFLRNWVTLGQPLIAPGNWGPALANVWWQDPSYRTSEQLTSFGTVLWRPLNAGVWSVWDSLYSTLWLDGFMSGTTVPPNMYLWNLPLVLVGAWLGLVPMALLLASPAAWCQPEFKGSRNALMFAAAAIALYLAAIVDLFVRLPIYSTAKATYTLGLLPCYAVLAAAGAAPLLKFRFLRAALFAAVTCWAISAYFAYFSTDYLRHRGMFAPLQSRDVEIRQSVSGGNARIYPASHNCVRSPRSAARRSPTSYATTKLASAFSAS